MKTDFLGEKRMELTKRQLRQVGHLWATLESMLLRFEGTELFPFLRGALTELCRLTRSPDSFLLEGEEEEKEDEARGLFTE